MKHIKPLKKDVRFGFCICNNTLSVSTERVTVCLGVVESLPFIERIDRADFEYLHTMDEKALKCAYKEILADIINNL